MSLGTKLAACPPLTPLNASLSSSLAAAGAPYPKSCKSNIVSEGFILGSGLHLLMAGEAIPATVSKLAVDSLKFRRHLQSNLPDVDMSYLFECTLCAYEEEMTVPMTVAFLWPAARR